MIIRHTLLRQGRGMFARCTERSARRWQSTDTPVAAQRFDNVAAFPDTPDASQPTAEVAQGSILPQKQQKKSSLQVAQEYTEFQRQKSLFKDVGGVPTPQYEPHTLVNNPPSPKEITLELLLASQSHMGHATSRWHPANAEYIFGVRDDTHIISLDATAAHLRRACKVVSAVTARGGLILFVGTREGQERSVVKAAELAGGYHLFDWWVPGTLTNSGQILGRCKLKVVNEFDEEVPGFEEQLSKVPPTKPDLVVVLNPLENQPLLQECAQHNVPTIGVIDTDANPLLVTYPVPANDDSLRCTNVIAGVLGRAGEEGRKHRFEQAESGNYLAESDARLRLRVQRNARR